MCVMWELESHLTFAAVEVNSVWPTEPSVTHCRRKHHDMKRRLWETFDSFSEWGDGAIWSCLHWFCWLKQTFSWRAWCHWPIYRQPSEMNIKDHLTGLVQQTPRWPLTPRCGDLLSTSDRPRRDPTVRKWWHCCRGVARLLFVCAFERVQMRREADGSSPRPHKMAASLQDGCSGTISRAARLNVAALLRLPASVSCERCHLNQSEWDTKSNRRERDDAVFGTKVAFWVESDSTVGF